MLHQAEIAEAVVDMAVVTGTAIAIMAAEETIVTPIVAKVEEDVRAITTGQVDLEKIAEEGVEVRVSYV